MRLSGHLGVLLGNAFGRINHDNAHISALYRQQRTHDREFLDFLVHLALLTDTGGVDERKLTVGVVHIGVYAVAGRTGDIGNDNTFLAEHAVEQAGLADVRLADEGHTNAVRVLLFLVCRREVFVSRIQQLTDTIAMQRRNTVRLAQTEVVELIKLRRRITRLVALVDSQHEWLARAQQHGRNVLIGGSNAGAQVGDQNNDIRMRDRSLCLKAHELQNLVIVRRLNAAGVDDGEITTAPVAVSVQAVAGNARRILNDGKPLARQAVEQLRLADVRTADNRNNRLCHKFPLL